MQKFFLYARKSTDVEDKQVLSIEAQLTELRELAKRENLEVVEELVEKQSAKIPGRPIFNEMLRRIEAGEAAGILAWHPDRLARNSVDGGKIIYLLDTGGLAGLKFPQFWYENTAQGKFMLNIAFGQSKYYIDNLSENTKRGLRQKVRRGEYPGLAPVGYQNDPRTKTVVVDKKRSVVIRKAFELYAQNNSRLEDIANFLAQNGILTSGGKKLHRDRISFILSNPFYYGHFRYAGEVHEGKHQPVVSKKIFDKVQEVMKQRGKPKTKGKVEKPFVGLLHCDECGRMITAEIQKGHTYYRCTKKNIVCSQPYVREEELDRQLSSLLQKFSLRPDWAAQMDKMLKKDKKESAQSATAFVQEADEKTKTLNIKLQRLLDGYLEQDIEREIYLEKKRNFMSEKKSLEEQIINFEQKRTGWLEPMAEWIKEAESLPKIAQESNLFSKKVAAEHLFGSNLVLANREARLRAPSGEDLSGENQWAALRAAHNLASKKLKSCLVV
ncbi:MAG: recombinase family protein, partial [Candidatus Doudnabacteria bacterium]|nr:recombinase family protein [Candidatus Doudnabacteria bacterium]